MKRASFSILIVVLLHSGASGQTSAGDAIALELFSEGKQLAGRGDHVHACEKFEAARAYASWVGIVLNLADCYERIGKAASAWALFQKAADDAAKQSDPRAAYASDRAAKLAGVVSHVTIAHAPVNVEVRFDHRSVARGSFGVSLPADPGEHTVEAVAVGRMSWSTRITVGVQTSIEVSVPELEPLIAVKRPVFAISLGAAGVAAVGTSLVLGLAAKLEYDHAVRDHCDSNLACDPQGFAAIRNSHERGNVATIIGGMGIVTVGAALVVYFSRHREDHPRLMPVATPSAVGVSLQGSL